MNVQEFSVNDPLLREMSGLGKSLLSKARIFENVFGAIVNKLRKGQQVDDYLCADLYQAYSLIQTHNKAHSPETGKRYAAEVKKWQLAKVRVPYTDEPQPFLKTTAPIAEKLSEIHSWFD